MKNFKFNLEPLLRLKEVEKKKIELELAHCQLNIDAHLNQLESENKSIRDMLGEAEYFVKKNGSIKSLLSVPSIMEVKKRNIKLLETKLSELDLVRKEILGRLNVKISEINNITEKKEEKIKEYKKQIEKIEDENISDLYKSVLHQKKSGAQL